MTEASSDAGCDVHAQPPASVRVAPHSHDALRAIRAGVGEWGVPLDELDELDDLDSVEVVHSDGLLSSAELKSRRLR
jgi:hypothetical protein